MNVVYPNETILLKKTELNIVTKRIQFQQFVCLWTKAQMVLMEVQEILFANSTEVLGINHTQD